MQVFSSNRLAIDLKDFFSTEVFIHLVSSLRFELRYLCRLVSHKYRAPCRSAVETDKFFIKIWVENVLKMDQPLKAKKESEEIQIKTKP